MKPTKPLILIVEDAPDQVKFLTAFLRAQNPDLDILDCGTVAKAKELLSKVQPKMVILDLVLEDGSGEEVLTHIKSTQPDVQVLIVTGDRNEATLTKLFELGAHDYITKPVDELIFRSKTRSLLSSKYVSPLSFLGKRGGIGTMVMKTGMELVKMDEMSAVVLSPCNVLPGGVFAINFRGVNLQFRVRNYQAAPAKGGFLLDCQVIAKSVENPADLRRAILGMEKPVTPAKKEAA